MTWFAYLTKNPRRLSDFLDRVQSDALEAEGCSIKLKLPPQTQLGDWEEWLCEECGLWEDSEMNWRNYP